jgi:DNA-binding LacI/PurR family transcriptional regulator
VNGQRLATALSPALPDNRHPTLADVATAAKVSASTASRALQGSPLISAATKRRVRAAAQGLGYQPNLIARSLRMQSTNFIGIVVPDIGIDFYSRVVKGRPGCLSKKPVTRCTS